MAATAPRPSCTLSTIEVSSVRTLSRPATVEAAQTPTRATRLSAFITVLLRCLGAIAV